MKKKHDQIVLLVKPMLNTIEVSVSKAFIDSNISLDQFLSVNNLLNEYDDINEEIKNSNK